MNVPLFNGTGWGATTPSDTGWSNQLVYSTPNIGGFKANLQYQFGEQAGNNGKKNVGANFFYFGGPLTLTGFYERDQISNPGAGSYLGTTKKDWMLLGAYDFGVVKPFVSYGQAKADNNPNKAKTVQLGALVPVGPAGKGAGRMGEDRPVANQGGSQDLHGGLRPLPVQAHRRVRHVHGRQDHQPNLWHQLWRRHSPPFLKRFGMGGQRAAAARLLHHDVPKGPVSGPFPGGCTPRPSNTQDKLASSA